MPQTINPLDILTSSGKYPEREQSDECTTEVRIQAAVLAERCSKLLDALGVAPRVSSGFRTTKSNQAVGGAGKSAHLAGEAVDLEDADGSLARDILKCTDLLDACDLYLESPEHTRGWVHLQLRRPRSGKRVFQP